MFFLLQTCSPTAIKDDCPGTENFYSPGKCYKAKSPSLEEIPLPGKTTKIILYKIKNSHNKLIFTSTNSIFLMYF